MWTTELATEYLWLLFGSWAVGWGLGYLVRAIERAFDLL